jgi:hypothetical protein
LQLTLRFPGTPRALFAGAALLFAAAHARAQAAPEAPPQAPNEPAPETSNQGQPPASDPAVQPKPAEQSEIEAALAADAKQEAEATDASVAPTPRSGGGSLNPDLSFIADFAAAWFSEDENLQSGGHDPNHTGFNLQALELSVGAAVDPYFRFDANIVLAEFGLEIEEAYGTTLDLPYKLQARLGQFLTRFGRINASHPHAWDFADQPFVIGRVFGAEGNRGLGVELSWLTPLPWYVELVASTIEAAGEATNRSFYGADNLGVDGPADLLYVTAIKQFFPLSDDWSLAWGVSGAFGPNSTGRANRTDVYGTDVYVKYRPISRESHTIVSLQTEILYRRRQVPSDVLSDIGGYSQLYWRFVQRWAGALRYEYGSPSFDSQGNTSDDPLDPEWTDSRHRVSAALTHSPTEFSRFRLQGSRDMPGWREGIWATFLTAELVTGAHGSHPF